MAELDFGREALPLYVQLKKIIKADIMDGTYAYGERIPAEIEFQNQYQVSRITVRRAISDLEKDGYVLRARGKGTKVIYQKSIEENLGKIRSFTEEMKQRKKIPGTRSMKISYECAPPEVAEAFGIKEGEPVLCLRRVRSADGEPIVYFVTYFPSSLSMPMAEERYQGSMYELFEELGIHKPTRVIENFKSVNATNEIAEKLSIKEMEALLVRTRISYNYRQEVIEYTNSYYRGDRYSYVMELKG